jgi:hypothetical protein
MMESLRKPGKQEAEGPAHSCLRAIGHEPGLILNVTKPTLDIKPVTTSNGQSFLAS